MTTPTNMEHEEFLKIGGMDLLKKNQLFDEFYLNLNGVFLKWWYPQIIHFKRVIYYKPSILRYPYFWKHPFGVTWTFILKPLWLWKKTSPRPQTHLSQSRCNRPGSSLQMLHKRRGQNWYIWYGWWFRIPKQQNGMYKTLVNKWGFQLPYQLQLVCDRRISEPSNGDVNLRLLIYGSPQTW